MCVSKSECECTMNRWGIQEIYWDLDEYGQVSVVLSFEVFDYFGVGFWYPDENHGDFLPKRRKRKATSTT